MQLECTIPAQILQNMSIQWEHEYVWNTVHFIPKSKKKRKKLHKYLYIMVIFVVLPIYADSIKYKHNCITALQYRQNNVTMQL